MRSGPGPGPPLLLRIGSLTPPPPACVHRLREAPCFLVKTPCNATAHRRREKAPARAPAADRPDGRLDRSGRAEASSQQPESRIQNPESRSQKPEARRQNQRPEARRQNQRPEQREAGQQGLSEAQHGRAG